MPNLGSVTKFFPTPFENSLAMTLNGTISPGAATVGVNNLGNYTNGQVVVFRIDSGTANAQVFTGTVSGANIVNVVWTYGTNVAHTDGAAIVDYASSTTVGMMSKGILQQHNQDGTHGVVTSTGLTNVGALNQTGAISLNGSWDGWVGANESWTFASSTTITVPTDATTKYDVGDYTKITQSATVKYFRIVSLTATVLTVAPLNGTDTVANSAISLNAYSKAHTPHGTSPAWVSWTPTYGGGGITVGNGTVVSKYVQIGKTVFFKYKLTLGSSTTIGTAPAINLPITSTNDYNLNTSVLGATNFFDTSANLTSLGQTFWQTTTTITPIYLDTNNAAQNVTAAAPFTWATGDILVSSGMYEAA